MKNPVLIPLRAARTFVALLGAGATGGTMVRGDVVFAWNELLLHFAAHSTDLLPPTLEVRAFAMTHLAMHEAVLASARLSSTANGRAAAQRAAAVVAARDLLVRLLPARTEAIEALAARHLGAIPSGEDKKRGTEIGIAVARTHFVRRQHDGWADVVTFNAPYGPPPNSSEMAAAGLARGGNLPPSPWLGVTPFGIKTVRQFSAAEVRTFTRSGEVVPDYFLQRSKLFNGVNTAAAVESGEGWLGVKPVVSWNRIARQISSVCGVDLAGQAQVLAMLNVALADAMISTLHWRYTIGSWRFIFVNGVEGIPSQPADGSLPLLAAWQPSFMQIEPSRALIPPMANYPSLCSSLAGAAQAALRNFFNTDEITFTLPVMAHGGDGGAVARTFTKISDAAREHAFVASVGGREIREACIAGYLLGTSIGGYVSKRRLPLRP